MAKIKVELEVKTVNTVIAEMVLVSCVWRTVGEYTIVTLFDTDLEIDEANNCFCKRCEQCKQAEVKE